MLVGKSPNFQSPRFAILSLVPNTIYRRTPGNAIDTGSMSGLGTVDQRMLILVDIEKLMTSDYISVADKFAA